MHFMVALTECSNYLVLHKSVGGMLMEDMQQKNLQNTVCDRKHRFGLLDNASVRAADMFVRFRREG